MDTEKSSGNGAFFFGLGDKPCALNLRGKYFSMWGADHYDFHEESDPLYKKYSLFPQFAGKEGVRPIV